MDEIADNLVLYARGYLIQDGIRELRRVGLDGRNVNTLQTEIINALIRHYEFVNRIPRNVLHNADYIVRVVFPDADNLRSFLPAVYKRFAEHRAPEVAGAGGDADDSCPPGPVQSQFNLLSDRVARLHASVLSLR